MADQELTPCPLCEEPLPPPEDGPNGAVIAAATEHLRRHDVDEWTSALVQARVAEHARAHAIDDLLKVLTVLCRSAAGTDLVVLDRAEVTFAPLATVYVTDVNPNLVYVKAGG